MQSSQYTNIAFISYKREDEEWSKWLQKKLEHYKLPTEIRKQNPDLEFAKNPRHVFKDTTDLSGGVLAKAIKEGLDSSKFLIVICSPRAAKSEWVCKEVQDFIDSGREEYIIPFIIDGEPYANNPEHECFPEALKTLAGERELLGININENGRDSAAVKVVARLFDLRFDTLWNRFKKEGKKRRNGTILFTSLFISVLIGVTIWMYCQRKETMAANWRMMENRAIAVAEKANKLIEEGDIYTAIKLCLEILPSDSTREELPFVWQAEAALRNADYVLRNANNQSIAHFAIPQDHDNDESDFGLINNSSYLWTCDNKILTIYDIYSGGISNKIKVGYVDRESFSMDGRYFVSNDRYLHDDEEGRHILIWDVESGKIVKQLRFRTLDVQYSSHKDYILCKSTLPDDNYLIDSKSIKVKSHLPSNMSLGHLVKAIYYFYGDSENMRLYDLEDQHYVYQKGDNHSWHYKSPYAFSDSLFARIEGGRLCVYDILTGNKIGSMYVHVHDYPELIISRNSNYLL